MRFPEFLKTTAFRQSVTIAAFFTLSTIVVFAFVFWQTVTYASREIDHEVTRMARAMSKVSSFYVDRRLNRWLGEEIRIERYGLLLDAEGHKIAGNMDRMPDGVVYDGRAYAMHIKGLDGDADDRDEVVRGVAQKLPDGRLLLVALDTDEWEHFRNVVFRALALGLIPTIALGCLGGAMFGRSALSRIAAMDRSIDQIIHGDLSERLPLAKGRRPDEFDHLARSVNTMLDDLQRLLLEVQAVGDSIAHDLRTPLTRMQARLENSVAKAQSADQLREVIVEARGWLEQTLGIITAVLRIGEIEHGQRRAAFRPFEAADLIREVHELMEPLAQEKGLRFELDVDADPALADGDRELLVEALVNLVDNAIKFTPAGGECRIGLARSAGEIVLKVQDGGPGIPEAERQAVMRRFYKAGMHRNSEGNGLGLALVAAVARLHGFDLSIGDRRPGCAMELRLPAIMSDTVSRPPAEIDA